ncbi:MAG: PQQ-binding-like beta-propeller repeat protein [bacterium]
MAPAMTPDSGSGDASRGSLFPGGAPPIGRFVRGGIARQGVFAGPGPRATQLSTRFSVRLVPEAQTAAITDGATIYLGSSRGRVVAAAVADGAIRWTFPTRAPARVGPGVFQERLFVGDGEGQLWCLDARTGKRRWRYKSLGAVMTAPVVTAGRVVFGTRAGRLVALDESTGQRRWELSIRRPFTGVAMEPRTGDVVAVSLDRHVRLVEGSSGRVRWAVDLGTSSVVHPVIAEDGIFVLDAAGLLRRLELRTGRELWRRPGFGFRSFAPIVAGGALYLASKGQLLYALDSSTGQTRWVKPLGAVPSAPPVFARDTVFVVTREPRLLAVRADSGAHYAALRLPRLVPAEPVPIRDGLLLVDASGYASLYVKK